MGSLQRDANEVREFVDRLDPNSNGRISFEEFLELMQQIENKIVKDRSDPSQQNQQYAQQQQMTQMQEQLNHEGSSRGMINVTADSKVLDFLRLLEEYRRKCEEQGNYAEARKSRSKFDELLKKETQRQRNNIRAAQEQELQNIESAQKAQFLEFSQAWDNYMSDYEATAYLSLEKLKVSRAISANNHLLLNKVRMTASLSLLHLTVSEFACYDCRRNTCLSSNSFRIKLGASCERA